MLLAKFLAWLAEPTQERRIVGIAAKYISLAVNRKVEFLPLTWPQIDRHASVIRTIRAKQRGKKREQIVEVVTPLVATRVPCSTGWKASGLTGNASMCSQPGPTTNIPTRGSRRYGSGACWPQLKKI